MEIKDIQKILDKNTTEKAQQEFKQAVHKAQEILKPFFLGTNELNGPMMDEQKQILSSMFQISHSQITCNIKTPSSYIEKRKMEESKKLIEKIAKLNDELEEIKEYINI